MCVGRPGTCPEASKTAVRTDAAARSRNAGAGAMLGFALLALASGQAAYPRLLGLLLTKSERHSELGIHEEATLVELLMVQDIIRNSR